MANAPQNGGPAFPGQMPTGFDARSGNFTEGMSLRDWFAGMALQGLLANSTCYQENLSWHEDAAVDAYDAADAMLQRRESLREAD